jgi:hypothetical protein
MLGILRRLFSRRAADSPVMLLGSDWGESRTSDRGGAQVLNLSSQLTLKNASNRRIRALTWLVKSKEATPGGRASVTKASLDVAPGETFPLRVDLRLLRPLSRLGGPDVEMSLDGVLFGDLSFYGPDMLDSRRVMLAFEMEAQRDRRHFLEVLQAKGPDGLRDECRASLSRQESTPRLDVQLARGGPGRSSAVEPDVRQVQFSFLRFPDAPVEAFAGMASVLGSEARSPRIDVQNKSSRAVKYLEVGWLVRDSQGREFLAGALPAKATLGPGARTQVIEQGALRFAEASGAPVSIQSMTGFVSQVEFADGSVWIPSRSSLADARLHKALAPSAEEMRLTNLYRKKGITAVIEELRRFAGQR